MKTKRGKEGANKSSRKTHGNELRVLTTTQSKKQTLAGKHKKKIGTTTNPWGGKRKEVWDGYLPCKEKETSKGVLSLNGAAHRAHKKKEVRLAKERLGGNANKKKKVKFPGSVVTAARGEKRGGGACKWKKKKNPLRDRGLRTEKRKGGIASLVKKKRLS